MQLFETIFNILLILICILFTIGFLARKASQPEIQISGLSGQRIIIVALLLIITIVPIFLLSFEWLAWLRTAVAALMVVIIVFVVKEGIVEEGVYTMKRLITWDEVTKYAIYKKSLFSTKIYIQLKNTPTQLKEARAKEVTPEINWFNFQLPKSKRQAVIELLNIKLIKKYIKK